MQVGLGLRAGQELVMSAPIEALPLVRRITDHAYQAGALLVTTFYADDPSVLARYEYAPDASFDYAPVWLQDGDCDGVPEWRGAAGDCGGESGAAGEAGSGEGGARECRGVEGEQAGDGADHAARDQLDDCGVRDAGVGEAGVSG